MLFLFSSHFILPFSIKTFPTSGTLPSPPLISFSADDLPHFLFHRLNRNHQTGFLSICHQKQANILISSHICAYTLETSMAQSLYRIHGHLLCKGLYGLGLFSYILTSHSKDSSHQHFSMKYKILLV